MLITDVESGEKEASNLQAVEKWSEALVLRRKIAEMAPDNWKNYVAIGDVLLNLSDWKAAAAAYKRAIEIEDQFDWAWHNLAVSLGRLERWSEAEKCHETLAQLNPDFWEQNGTIPMVQQQQTDYMQWKDNQCREDDSDLPILSARRGVNSGAARQTRLTQSSKDFESLTSDFEELAKNVHYEGGIDHIAANQVVGWVANSKSFGSYRTVILKVDGTLESEAIANLSKAEVKPLSLQKNGRCWFRLQIPDDYLDGKVHRLEVLTPEGLLVDKPVRYTLSIAGYLDILTANHVAGWILDSNAAVPLDLDLYVNDKKICSSSTDLDRKDVDDRFPCGFDIFFQQDLYQYQKIALTLKNSNRLLFGTPKILFSSVGAIEALHRLGHLANGKDSNLNAVEKNWLLGELLPQLIEGTRASRSSSLSTTIDLHPVQVISPSQSFSKHQSEVIDVIIPVYGNYEVTKRCIEAAINAKNDTPCNIIAIDDRGPDPLIHEYLSEQSNKGAIELIVNEDNKGFVFSVNQGMRLYEHRDVVLLNADAIVSDFWLDRLKIAAYQDSNIASATPFSNHASIFSYPKMCEEVSDLPKDVRAEELNEMFYLANGEDTITVPAMHGFCCFLKREALSRIGLFDEEKWGKGYGEEVDWSQRAMREGWRHVAAPSVFVEHVGSQSFTVSKDEAIRRAQKKISSEFPEFDAVVQDFISQDPFASCRRKVDVLRLTKNSNKHILYISHDFGGGTQRHIMDMGRKLSEEGTPGVCLMPDKQNWVKLISLHNIDICSRYNLDEPDDAACLVNDLKEINVFHMHIHSTIGFVRDRSIWDLISRLGLPYDVTLHDYHYVCPRITLTVPSGKYCGEPSASACNVCILKHNTYDAKGVRDLYDALGSVDKWRQYFYKKLKLARKVFVPSHDVKDRVENYFSLTNIEVKFHLEVEKTIALESKNISEKTRSTYRVALIGGISDAKGYSILLDVADYALRFSLPLNFIVFGKTKNDLLFDDMENVNILGPYKDFEELSDLHNSNPCDVSAFFSRWPETYSYTLSEALSLGLTPLSLNIGAIAERVRSIPGAVLLSPDAPSEKIAAKLIEMAKKARSCENSFTFPKEHSYGKLMDDYYDLSSPFTSV